MCKNLLYSLAILIVVTLGMASCSREYHPQFASGRFLHIVKDNRTPYEAFSGSPQLDKIDPLSAKTPQELLIASSEAEVQSLPLTRMIQPTLIHSQLQKNKKTISLKSIVVKKEAELKTNTSSYPKGKVTNGVTHTSDDIRLLCAIIAIFIPPLGVALYEKKITINFWIDLILTLIFWLPGFIFALFVILT